MPRVIWFALGAVAGMVYASRLIETEHLDEPKELPEPDVQKAQSKEKLATLIEARSAMIGGLIRERGQMIAAKLRGQALEQRRLEPISSPFGEPAMVDTRQAATVGARYQPDLGLESTR